MLEEKKREEKVTRKCLKKKGEAKRPRHGLELFGAKLLSPGHHAQICH